MRAVNKTTLHQQLASILFMNPTLKASLFVLIVAVAFPMMAAAQSDTAFKLEQKIHSLKQRKNYLQDTAYANALCALGYIYADSYPDSAIALLSGHAARCKSMGFIEGEVDAYEVLGNAYQTKGDFEKSLGYYKQAYAIAEKIDYQWALARLLNNIGLVYLNKGNYSTALHNFYEALKKAEAGKKQFLVGIILNNIAVIHFFQNKLPEAEADYRKMLAIAQEMFDTIGVITAYNNIGEVNLEQDSAFKAMKNLNIALNLALITKNPEMLAASTKTLGDVYLKLDSLPKAKLYFQNAVGLSREQGNVLANCKALIGWQKFKPGRER